MAGAGRVDGDIFSMRGKVILVTGTSSGLGRHMAGMLAARGASVVGVSLGDAGNPATAAAEVAAGRIDIECDVTSDEAIRNAFDAAESAFGPVTGIVNNAGISHLDRAIDLDTATWREVMAVNLDAAFAVAREAARRMRAAGQGGSIVNVSSILSEGARKGSVAYNVSKAGIDQLTRTLAAEWARHGIRVNTLSPGWFDTPMTRAHFEAGLEPFLKRQNPMGRLGEPADLDGALLLLLSDAGRYMTGSSIVVDGGQRLSG